MTHRGLVGEKAMRCPSRDSVSGLCWLEWFLFFVALDNAFVLSGCSIDLDFAVAFCNRHEFLFNVKSLDVERWSIKT